MNTTAMLMGSMSFAIFGTAIFEAEELMHRHYKLAIVVLLTLGLLHTFLKHKGIAVEAPAE